LNVPRRLIRHENQLRLANGYAGRVDIQPGDQRESPRPVDAGIAAVVPEAFAARIKRQGVVNAWDDEAFAGACRKTGKRNFVMAGVTTDICMVSPAISAVEEGYNVKIACDACGSTNQIAEEMSWRRMERAGVQLTSTGAMVAELVKNWASPAGAVAFPLLT
jgi:isochorismate hydrolase